MKILFACGGTAGHINPALAIANQLCRDDPKTKVLFAGNPDGMEARLVPKAGYGFAPIRIEGFQRKPSFTNFKRNIHAVACLMTASPTAQRIIRDFQPDIVIGTGGYVSGPVLRQAAKMGIATLTHEQNAFPGVTTKILCRYVDKVLLAVDRARDFLPRGREYIVTGNPIRQELLLADREKARQRLNTGDRICILSFGGSLGAAKINQAMVKVMADFRFSDRVHHIHATGRYGVEDVPEMLEDLGVNYRENPHMDIREYIDDMPDCLSAADLVICRAGALSLSELEAVGRASVLIPSPNVAENHQYHNAMVLSAKNAAIVIEEKDLTGEMLSQVVFDLINDPQELKNIGRNASSMAILDACERICHEIYALYAKK